MFLARWAIQRPVATLMLMTATMVVGVLSIFYLQMDILPKINPPIMTVVTELPGASAQEVLTLVTEPMESATATVSGIKSLRSISRESMSMVVLQFDWNVNMSDVRAELTEKIEALPLPADAGKPQVNRFDPTQFPLMQVFASSEDKDSLAEVSRQVTQSIKPRLEAVPGVAAVNIVGGVTKEVRVELDAQKLSTYRIGLSRVAGLVAAGTASMPVGVVTEDNIQKNLRIPAKTQNVDDLGQITVGFIPVGRDMHPVTVSDLGTVVEGEVEGRSATRLNRQPAVGLQIHNDGSSNTAAVARAVRQELENIRRDLPELTLAVALDQGAFIEESLQTSARSLVMGGFFAMAVLLAFLGSLLSTVIVAVAIPFSILATFVLLFTAGFTLNVMTLGGLALGVGMFVDNSIVVIENIYRHLQLGKSPTEAAEIGSGEVAGAITAATMTTVVVFLPVVFVGGLTGTLFRELAVTVTFALLCSLIVSLTVIPMLASRWLKPSKDEGWRKRLRRRETMPNRILNFALHRKGIILGTSLLLLALAISYAPRIGSEFLPSVDEGVISVDLRLPVGTPLHETLNRVERLENELLQMRDVEQVTSLVGAGAGFAGARSALRGAAGNTAQIIVTLKDDAPPTLTILQAARDLVFKVKKVDEDIVFNLYSSLFFSPGSSANLLQLAVSGPDLERLRPYAADLVQALEDVPGLTGVQSNADVRLAELHLLVDDTSALRAGLSSLAVGNEVRRAVVGQITGRIRSAQELVNIRVMMQENDRNTIEALQNLPLEAGGQLVPLSEVAEVTSGFGPATIIREDQRPSIELTGQIEGRDIGSVLADALIRVEELGLPPEMEIRSVGAAILMQEGFSSLRSALLLSLFLIYMVMAAQFESLRSPLVILFTAPLAVIGVVSALLLTHTSFGITAYIGVIILAGIVVNNGIVLVDFAEKLRHGGHSVKDAAQQAVLTRTRPVLMTAFTTILGLLPLAAQLGDGTELQAPLARVVIGGMLSATILTLVVIPVIYSILYRKNERVLVGDGK